MALSNLPLSYCANVHAGQSVAEVFDGLTQYTAPLAASVGFPMATGLWLAEPVIAEMVADPSSIERLSHWLRDHELTCYTMNAFPYGNFHARRVKEDVYLPTWSSTERMIYTCRVADVLAKLLPEGAEGSISTLPLGFKPLHSDHGFAPHVKPLMATARHLRHLRETTGRTIRLAIEPEPFCLLETTTEAINFFRFLRGEVDSGERSLIDDHLGLCYDVCHQAVEFEDPVDSIERLVDARIPIVKVHVTCALELAHPHDDAARAELATFAEERYLHQTFQRTVEGEMLRLVDLTADHARHPPEGWRHDAPWRIHFHVPVHLESVGALKTTRPYLREALRAVAELPYAPHLEVETYTWGVLPDEIDDEPNGVDLVSGLRSELQWTRRELDAISQGSRSTKANS